MKAFKGEMKSAMAKLWTTISVRILTNEQGKGPQRNSRTSSVLTLMWSLPMTRNTRLFKYSKFPVLNGFDNQGDFVGSIELVVLIELIELVGFALGQQR